MSNLPLSIGLIHFIGIGGIGMSGIAEVLNELGYKVSGSDIAENNNTKRLKDLGGKTFFHDGVIPYTSKSICPNLSGCAPVPAL